MAPPMRSHQTRRTVPADTVVSGPYMDFSMSLVLAYQHATLDSAQQSACPLPPAHSRRKPPAGPRAPPRSEITVAPSVKQPAPTSSACDTTLDGLSAEAQRIQDQARASYNQRRSKFSDRESLHCLESFPLHIHWGPTAATRVISSQGHRPLLLPKYYPSSPSRRKSPRGVFDDDAPRTTQPTNSSGKPLKSIQGFRGGSFSDDPELFRDDDFFIDDGIKVGDRLPVGGISLFARLEEIRRREARGSSAGSPASASLPRVASVGSTENAAGGPDESGVDSDGDEVEDWLHVEKSAVLRREIEEEEEEERQQLEVEHTAMASQEVLQGENIMDSVIVGEIEDEEEDHDDDKYEQEEKDEKEKAEYDADGPAMSEEDICNLMIQADLAEAIQESTITKTSTYDEVASDHSVEFREVAEQLDISEKVKGVISEADLGEVTVGEDVIDHETDSHKKKDVIEEVDETDDWLQVELS